MHMKQFKLYLTLTCAALWHCADARTIVADSADNAPLVAASVFDSLGTLVAITDTAGGFDAAPPVSVRCLGYEPATMIALTDTLRLTPASYELPGMTVNLAERDVLRLICYAREYMGLTTSRDTAAVFAEYMVDYMLPVKKLKKYKGRYTPRILNKRSVKRELHAGEKSDSLTTEDDTSISWLQLAGLYAGKDGDYGTLPDSILSGKGITETRGKSGVMKSYRLLPQSYVVIYDALADKKDHRWSPWLFKMLGMTIVFNELRGSSAYAPTPNGSLHPENLLMSTFAFEADGRGKFFRKALDSTSPVTMKSFIEIYPVDREYLTVTEAREADKDETAQTEFTVPAQAIPLDDATQRLAERARLTVTR